MPDLTAQNPWRCRCCQGAPETRYAFGYCERCLTAGRVGVTWWRWWAVVLVNALGWLLNRVASWTSRLERWWARRHGLMRPVDGPRPIESLVRELYTSVHDSLSVTIPPIYPNEPEAVHRCTMECVKQEVGSALAQLPGSPRLIVLPELTPRLLDASAAAIQPSSPN